MDISNLSSLYSAQAKNAEAGALSDSLKNKDYSQATDEELMDACKKFESYFVEQMYKEMLKTVPESEFSSASNSTMLDFFKEKYVTQIAEDTSERGDLGLAKMLYEQMKRS
ncbi:MAG: rod-binding protein [Lachnospiraceae bacterium]|nr:rod-binding protein [Lachnospiraceae bacterium]